MSPYDEEFEPALVNRAAVTVKVKQPFVDWANSLPDNTGLIVSVAKLNENPHTYLVPQFDMSPDIKQFVEDMKPYIFESELNGWCMHEPWWPQDRTAQIFEEWFEITISELIFDLDDEENFYTEFDGEM